MSEEKKTVAGDNQHVAVPIGLLRVLIEAGHRAYDPAFGGDASPAWNAAKAADNILHRHLAGNVGKHVVVPLAPSRWMIEAGHLVWGTTEDPAAIYSAMLRVALMLTPASREEADLVARMLEADSRP